MRLPRETAEVTLHPREAGRRVATAASLSDRGGRERGRRGKQQWPRSTPARDEGVAVEGSSKDAAPEDDGVREDAAPEDDGVREDAGPEDDGVREYAAPKNDGVRW